MLGIEIAATGSYVPKHIANNDALSKIMDTNDEWITARTGIRRRHYAKEETNLEMATKASAMAFASGNIKKEDIGFCLFSTFTPDTMTPPMSCSLQGALGLPEDILAMDINGACSGFLYGLSAVYGFLLQNPNKYGLLVGSEVISEVINFEDRSTAVLFGDGAGAVVVGLKDNAPFVFSSGTRSDENIIRCEGIKSAKTGKMPVIDMNGKEVFRFAVEIVPSCIYDILTKAELRLDEVDYIICHQANERIISHVCKKLKVPQEKFYMNLQEYGNTSSASIPLVFDEMNQKGLLKKGMNILCVGFGAGLSWGGAYFRW